MSFLYERITREHDGGIEYRRPAKGALINHLENIIHSTKYSLIGFDGYIIPKDILEVTLLLFCREYDEEQLKNNSTEERAKALFDELKVELDFDLACEFAKQLNCNIACVFTPYDYPKNNVEVKEQNILLLPQINNKRTVKKQNVDEFREFLKDHKKRYSRKPVTFIPTKLEYYLANVADTEWKIAFPGDADGILMDEDYNVQAILEYKSDTQGNILKEEAIKKYEADSTRFNVLDDFCKLLNVPLIVIFWSDTHSNAKITIRNSLKGIENSLPIIKSNDYYSCADKIYNVLIDLNGNMGKLNLL